MRQLEWGEEGSDRACVSLEGRDEDKEGKREGRREEGRKGVREEELRGKGKISCHGSRGGER